MKAHYAWALGLSAAVHGGLLAWLGLRPPPPPIPGAPPVAAEPIEWTQIEVLPDPVVPAPAAAGVTLALGTGASSGPTGEPAPGPGRANAPASAIDVAPPGEPAAGEIPPGETAPPRAGLPPAPGAVAREIVPDPGPPPSPSPLALRPPPRLPYRPRIPRSEITSDGKGAYRAGDLTFDARIGRDGRVQMNDKPNLHASIALPSARDVGRHIENWSKDPYGTAAADERAVETGTVTILSGGFDVTDWAMRAAGIDPYYHRKKAFLDGTFEQRSEMAIVARDDDLRDAIANLGAHLRKVWGYQPWSPRRRRQALFQLWDECAETGPAAVVEAADRARATIVAFIRRELPRSSGNGYSDDELAAHNRVRQSERVFAPYRAQNEP